MVTRVLKRIACAPQANRTGKSVRGLAGKGTGFAPVPLKNSYRFSLFGKMPQVVPLGINRGEVNPLVMAWKIAVSFVMLALLVSVAAQPSASSE